MKKALCILTLTVLIISLFGCGRKEDSSPVSGNADLRSGPVSGEAPNVPEKTGGDESKSPDVSKDENIFSLSPVYGNIGDTVTTDLCLSGRVKMCAFDLRIYYDPTRLKYIGTKDENDDLIVNCNEDEGYILMNFLRIVNLDEPVKFCNIEFKVKTAEKCSSDLDIKVVQAAAIDEKENVILCDFSAIGGIAYLNQGGE